MRATNLPENNCIEDCLLTQALSGLCVGLILTDSAEKVIWVNRVAERVLGLSHGDCLGKHLPQMLKDLRLAAFWQEAGETAGNTMGDVTVQWPERLSLKVNATRYIDRDGAEVGRALLFCDVTAERTLQVELSDAVARRLLNLTSDQAGPPAASNLTHQEVRILRLVGRGLANDDIATEADISLSTVRSHLKSIYKKLDLHSRSEAVSYAVRHDIS